MGIARNVIKAVRRLRLRTHRGLSLGANCDIGPSVLVETGGGQVTIGADCTLSAGVVLAAYGDYIQLARWVHVGPYTTIYGHGGVTIGEGTLIAMHCRILSSSHTIAPQGTFIRSQPDILQPTSIGRDVWLGAGVTVFGGVTIGDGCVVGAGSAVTRDLPPGAVAYGSPAEIRSYREGSSG